MIKVDEGEITERYVKHYGSTPEKEGESEQVPVVKTIGSRIINELISKKLAMIKKIQSDIQSSDVDGEDDSYRKSRVIMLESEVDYLNVLLQKAPIEVQRALAVSIIVSKMTPLQNEIRTKKNFDTKVPLNEEEVSQKRKETWQLHAVLKELERESRSLTR